jgi:hypothetical protein
LPLPTQELYILWEGQPKLTRKKTIDEGYIAPGLRGATKTNKKKTIDEGEIAPGWGGATKTNKKKTKKERKQI